MGMDAYILLPGTCYLVCLIEAGALFRGGRYRRSNTSIHGRRYWRGNWGFSYRSRGRSLIGLLVKLLLVRLLRLAGIFNFAPDFPRGVFELPNAFT